VAGSLASVTLQILHPFDLLKIRYQSNDGGGKAQNLVPKYTSLINSLKTISRSEGPSAFFRGLSISIVGNNLSYGLFFGLFAWSKQKVGKFTENETLVTILGSAFSGMISSFLFQPIWVLKTRRLLDLEKGHDFNRVPKLGKEIYTQYGVKGFFRGYFLTLALASYGVFQLSFYDIIKRQTDRFYSARTAGLETTPTHMIATIGILSRLTAGCFLHPLTTVRTRIQQNQYMPESGEAQKYSNYREVLGKTWHQEGIRGFYKGIVPMTLRSAPAQGLFFVVYEWGIKTMSKKYPMVNAD